MPNFSSISLQMADLSLFFAAKSCQVPSVPSGFTCKMCLKSVTFEVGKFQLDTLSRFRMVEEKHEGAYFNPPPPPPGKIGLKYIQTPPLRSPLGSSLRNGFLLNPSIKVSS